MAIPKITGAQRDFSGGELDVTMKRADDHPVMKTGARQALNWRVLNTNTLQNRPGRSALFLETGRVERVQMSPGFLFYLAFGGSYVRVYNVAGVLIFQSTVRGDGSPIPWTGQSASQIVWDIYKLSIYITYGDGAPNNVPQILTWDGVSEISIWTLATYSLATIAGNYRTPFYRLSPQGIAIWPSFGSGSVNIVASAPVFVSGMVGTRIRFAYQEILITAVTSSINATGTVLFQLPAVSQISWLPAAGALGSPGNFSAGDVVNGSVSGTEAVVVFTDATHVYTVNLNAAVFATDDVIIGPKGTSFGTLTITLVSYNSISPAGITIWDDEVMNNFRGWPKSCFFDQSRFGLCDFPALPEFICWSAIGIFNDQYTDPLNAGPGNSVQELAPNKSHVMYVLPGMEASEFVFCDNAVYFIPITVTSPLIPGSVGFTQLSKQGCQPGVQPRYAEQTLVFMKSGGVQVGAVQAPGAYYRPYIIDNISELHGHLFPANSVVSIAIPSASRQFEELYIYVQLSNGTLVVGKYAIHNGLLEAGSDTKPKISWVPWNGAGLVTWVSAQADDVHFVTQYTIGGAGEFSVVEQLDNTKYLDGAIFVNNPPVPLAPGGGQGPLWWLAFGTVTLIDNGTRMMGTYNIDGTGHIIPQDLPGENLLSANLVAGQPWTATLEPFAPDAQPGQDFHQRMFKRRIARFGVYVSNSTGFLMARLFSGPLTRTSPALGTIMNSRRIDTWNQDDDPTQPPPLREEVQRWRPLGRAFDPRVAVIKDTPGPLVVHEIDMEATV